MSDLDKIIAAYGALQGDEKAEADAAIAANVAEYPWAPNVGPQTMAYFSPADELLFGGEAGGGKSELLLGLALNEHDVSQIFRLQHNDRVALVRRLGEILDGVSEPPKGYRGDLHEFRRVIAGKMRIIEFGALATPGAWQHYQGRPASAKLWDELAQFAQDGYITVNGWLRSVNPNQRTRIVAASNPPVTPEGLWIIDRWAAWLDPRHANPAKDGELRFYMMIDGVEQEVDANYSIIDDKGRELRPRSRTFVRSSLSDNPDLEETGYGNALAALPKTLRDALYSGKFSAALEDNPMQVIPTEWIMAAQDRWMKRKDQDNGPITAVGVDPNGGGKDEFGMVTLRGTFFDEPILETGLDFKKPRKSAAFIIENIDDDPQINVDCTGGWGNGIVEHLEEHYACKALGMANKSTKRTKGKIKYGFANKRAEYIWQLGEALDPDEGDNIALPAGEYGRRIIQELSTVRFIQRGRVILIEPKEDIIARIRRSPTILDMFAYAWAEADPIDRAERPSSQRKARKGSGRSLTVHTSYENARSRYNRR